MEAIDYITQWTDWLMFYIIPAGAGFRIAYQAWKKSMAVEGDEIADANKKIKTSIIGAVVAVTMGGTITVIKSFYGF